MERKKQLRFQTERKDEVISKIWSGSGDNLILKLPNDVWDKKMLVLERQVRLTKVKKGEVISKSGLLVTNL